MKALTLWQPWASLVALGVKTIETRSWSTGYRGPLAIHAASTNAGFDTLPGDCEGTTEGGWRYGYLGEVQAAYGYRTSGEGQRGDAYVHDLGPQGTPEPIAIPLGAIVATCELVDVVPTDALDWFEDKWGPTSEPFGWKQLQVIRPPAPRDTFVCESEHPFGDFTPGRFAWLLGDIEPLAEPAPARGHQQLWEWAA